MTSWQQACTKANSLCQSEAWTSHVIHFLSPSLPLPQAESLVHQTTGMSLISRWNCSSFRWRVVKGGGRGKNGDTRLRLVLCGQRSRALSNFGEKDAAKCRNAPGKLLKWLAPLHRSCQPLLGVNLSPEFVNLYFPYAGQGLLFFCWWQRHFEFQPAHVAAEGRSNVVQNSHARLQISLPARLLSLLR